MAITTLNGLPGSWDSRNVCQKEMITFNRIQEECTQEEDRHIINGENMRATKDQALMMRNMKKSILEEPLIHLII